MKQLLYFTAEWCTPCRAQERMFDGLKIEFDGDRLKKLDVDNPENRILRNHYNISAIPTIIVVHDDDKFDKYVGVTFPKKLKDIMGFLSG